MEESKGTNGAPADAANGDQGNDAVNVADNVEQKRDVVKYDTYSKVVGHNKKLQSRLEELESRIMQTEQQKLEAEGKKDELIESLRSQLGEREEKLKDVTSTFAYRSVTEQVRAEAAKLGCVDSSALVKLLDLGEVDIDSETFSANSEQIQGLLEQSKQKYPYLFGKPAPKFAEGVPSSNQKFEVDTSKMSAAELHQFYVQKFGNKI